MRARNGRGDRGSDRRRELRRRDVGPQNGQCAIRSDEVEHSVHRRRRTGDRERSGLRAGPQVGDEQDADAARVDERRPAQIEHDALRARLRCAQGVGQLRPGCEIYLTDDAHPLVTGRNGVALACEQSLGAGGHGFLDSLDMSEARKSDGAARSTDVHRTPSRVPSFSQHSARPREGRCVRLCVGGSGCDDGSMALLDQAAPSSGVVGWLAFAAARGGGDAHHERTLLDPLHEEVGRAVPGSDGPARSVVRATAAPE